MNLTKNQSTRALLLAILATSAALAQTTVPPVAYAYNGPPLNISYTTGSAATFLTIPVSSVVTITKLTATVNISYAPVSDLNLYLFSPDGTRTRLLERNCSGTASATLVNITFDDSGTSTYNSFCPAEAGRGPFKSNEPLSNFNGKAAGGNWTLAVQNNRTTGNTGVVNGVSLTISGTTTTAPVISANTIYNAVTLQPGPIAPGEILAISGSNLGPATPVAASSGNLPTTLGGVQLSINGSLSAPLLYASSTLVVAILPYNAAGSGATIGGTVTLMVTNNSVPSNLVTTGVAYSSPALFTVANQETGKIGVKAINPDGTLNAVDNPVAAGAVVTLYAAGLGPVTPSFTAGQVAPPTPLYNTMTETFVNVAGQFATVLFSGLAPGTLGAYQVNMQIPASVPSGAQPILLWNQGGTSQNGLQIFIK